MVHGLSPDGQCRLVADCYVALFRAYGVTVEWTRSPRLYTPTLGASIAFDGDHAQGHLVVTATDGLLEAPGFEPASPAVWIPELANQLLARIKNRLLAKGTILTLATPIALHGPELNQRPLKTGASVRGPNGQATAWFEVENAMPSTQDGRGVYESAVPEGTILTF